MTGLYDRFHQLTQIQQSRILALFKQYEQDNKRAEGYKMYVERSQSSSEKTSTVTR